MAADRFTDALPKLAPTFATETGTCRADDCSAEAPVIVIGRNRTQLLCPACQEADDRGDTQRETRRLLERAGIPRRLAAWTLDTYATDGSSGWALNEAQRWLADFLAGRNVKADVAAAQGQRRNLLMVGGIGTGKSSLAAAITRHLCEQGIGARWVVLRDLLELKRESFDGGQPVDTDPLRRAPLLVLDDLGAERLTPWAIEQLEVIVSTRYDACNPLICTSNLTPAQLAAAIAASSDHELIRAKRIVSRLTEGAQRIDFDTADRRLRSAAA